MEHVTENHKKIVEELSRHMPELDAARIGAKLAKELGFVRDETIPEKSSSEIYRECEDRGNRWASAFVETAKRIGAGNIDEGWMIGWFCNAIECAVIHRGGSVSEQEPKLGAVVVLNSGGPLMLVKKVDGDVLTCTWEAGKGGMLSGTFLWDTVYVVVQAPEVGADGFWSNVRGAA